MTRLALCGLPPYGRGTTTPGKDTDLQIHKVFPDCTLFVEKPISATSDIDDVKRVAKQLEECITSCGYMFRYLRGKGIYDTIGKSLQVKRSSLTLAHYHAYW